MLCLIGVVQNRIFLVRLIDCGNNLISISFHCGSDCERVRVDELHHCGVKVGSPVERNGNLDTSRTSYECENVD